MIERKVGWPASNIEVAVEAVEVEVHIVAAQVYHLGPRVGKVIL